MQKSFSICLFLAALVAASFGLDTFTGQVHNDGSQVISNDPNGNSATSTNDNSGNVGNDFNVGGNSGHVDANAASDGSTIGANGPNGEAQTGTIDTSNLNADLHASSGDSVVAKSSPGGVGEHTVDINGNPSYKIDRPDADKLTVNDVGGGGGNYKITGIQTQKNINVAGPNNKQYQAQMDKAADGTVKTKLKEKTFLNFGPASASQLSPPNSANDGSAKIGYNPLDSGSSDPLSSIAPSATITVDKINTKPCPEKEYGDAFGDNGFKIFDDSINVELPPSDDSGDAKTWAFPGCFIIHADVQIPPNIDPHNVGGQAQATVAQAGDLQCDTSLECQSGAAGKPSGPCFFCDFCEKDSDHQKSNAVFGSNADSDWNICSGKPGSRLPLQWKMCPKDGNNYNVLQPNILNMKGDIEATIKVYLKKSGAGGAAAPKPSFCTGWFASFYPQCKGTDSGESWQLMGCRKSVISYKVSALNGAVNYGSSGGLFGRRK